MQGEKVMEKSENLKKKRKVREKSENFVVWNSFSANLSILILKIFWGSMFSDAP